MDAVMDEGDTNIAQHARLSQAALVEIAPGVKGGVPVP